MTISRDLTPAQNARLVAEAEREGLEPAKLVERLVLEHLSHELPFEFSQWGEKDEKMTAADIAEENQAWIEYESNIN